MAHYNIYRDGVVVGSESSTNHTAVGLTPATSYEFQVSALDAAGNESNLSYALSVATWPTIHVGGLDVTLDQYGSNYRGRVTVLVLDHDGVPASGVEVEGFWTWNSTDLGPSSGVTNSSGVVSFSTDKMKSSSGDVFTFTVTDLILSGYLYDPAMNVKTSDSATVQ